MDDKPRKPFTLWADDGEYLGCGIYYPNGGNCQVYMDRSQQQAWQFAHLGEVLLLEKVVSFQWERQ